MTRTTKDLECQNRDIFPQVSLSSFLKNEEIRPVIRYLLFWLRVDPTLVEFNENNLQKILTVCTKCVSNKWDRDWPFNLSWIAKKNETVPGIPSIHLQYWWCKAERKIAKRKAANNKKITDIKFRQSIVRRVSNFSRSFRELKIPTIFQNKIMKKKSVVVFDIGGVVTCSPLNGIREFERKYNLKLVDCHFFTISSML